MTAMAHAPFEALSRHFIDLRDGNHSGQTLRNDKEAIYLDEVVRLDAPVRQVLTELNEYLLLGTGMVGFTDVHRDTRGGLVAVWALTWPEQEAAGLPPVAILATFGAGNHHPHLRGSTVGEWPLNVATEAQATELVPVLRTIVGSDLHNLVFRVGGDWRIVPATVEDRLGSVNGQATSEAN